ncbi:MAG: stage III sporulation protein AA [Cellulosilyticaceae bacterium]
MNGKNILDMMPHHLKEMFLQIPKATFETVQEIRLRIGRPLIVHTGDREYGISYQGLCKVGSGYDVQPQDVESMIKFLSSFSFYAWEDEMRQGFITIEGGHRIGIVGKVVVESERIKTIKHISGLNMRIAHEVKGCSNKVLPYVLTRNRVCHTLIVSPPKCGKTTLLRDMIRQLSNGYSGYGPYTIGVVDERSEIAGCYKGIPQNDVGIRTDVLDGCAKVEGMRMLLRSMAPDIIAVDEIGSEKDMLAIEEVLGAGVSILCTTHGMDVSDCMKKPLLRRMIDNGLFEKIVVLSNRCGPCTVEEVRDIRLSKVGM